MSIDAEHDSIEITLDRPAGGAASVGRTDEGLVVFADGGLPGETVRVELHTRRKRFARGVVVEVVAPSAGRRVPECATARAGCGGCDLAHATREAQLEMKVVVVRDALERIAQLTDVPEIRVRSTDHERYRTTVRAAVVDGRAGYRRRRSHDVVAADECLVAHPAIEELLRDGRWGPASEVTLRASAKTGERLAVVDGSLAAVTVPDDVMLVSRDSLASSEQPFVTEHAGGRDWRLSAGSFFQAGPAAASALVEAVTRAVGDTAAGHLVDAYAGIGLFGGTVGRSFDRVTAIERSPSAVADARVNLGDDVRIESVKVESWAPKPADVVVADPARAGLGPPAAERLCESGASQFVLVSCDTGSLGRDARILVDAGYRVSGVEVVDAFPQTSQVETVLTLNR